MPDEQWPQSQCQPVGANIPQTWKDYRNGCLSTYFGGHQTQERINAFQHGMETVFNLLEAEFPEANLCKQANEIATLRAQLTEAQAALEAERTARKHVEQSLAYRDEQLKAALAREAEANTARERAERERDEARIGLNYVEARNAELQRDLAAANQRVEESEQVEASIDQRLTNFLYVYEPLEAMVHNLQPNFIGSWQSHVELFKKYLSGELKTPLQEKLTAAKAEAETLRGRVATLQKLVRVAYTRGFRDGRVYSPDSSEQDCCDVGITKAELGEALAISATVEDPRDEQIRVLRETLKSLTQYTASVLGGPIMKAAGVEFKNGVDQVPILAKCHRALAATQPTASVEDERPTRAELEAALGVGLNGYLIEDGIFARKQAIDRVCALGRELDGEEFNENMLREACLGLTLAQIAEHVRSLELRFDARYAPKTAWREYSRELTPMPRTHLASEPPQWVQDGWNAMMHCPEPDAPGKPQQDAERENTFRVGHGNTQAQKRAADMQDWADRSLQSRKSIGGTEQENTNAST